MERGAGTVEMVTVISSGDAEGGMNVFCDSASVSFLRKMFHLNLRVLLSFVLVDPASPRLYSAVELGVDVEIATAEARPSSRLVSYSGTEI
jgi:hypothetical protein